jgi:hypothetical protein
MDRELLSEGEIPPLHEAKDESPALCVFSAQQRVLGLESKLLCRSKSACVLHTPGLRDTLNEEVLEVSMDTPEVWRYKWDCCT